jgi:hypothetical protein
MLRKYILTGRAGAPPPRPGEKDIAALATVLVTSETTDHPIDNVFDSRRGPGGSRWVAAEPGEQVLILAFDAPQTIHTVSLEVEEPGSRWQPATLFPDRQERETSHGPPDAPRVHPH